MYRELVSDPLGRNDLWADLKVNIETFKSTGYHEGLVLFGFSWGRYIYDGPWQDLPMTLDTVLQRILEAEAKEWGRLGDDNLYITIKALTLRLHYSHESDIHLSYGDENPMVERIRQRWLSQGWLSEMMRSRTYNR